MDISSITGPVSAAASTNARDILPLPLEVAASQSPAPAEALSVAPPPTTDAGSPAQATVKKPEPPAKPPSDDVKLSQQARAELLKSQGESLSEIATRLGVSVSAVNADLYLDIPATPDASPATAGSVPAASSLSNVASASLASKAAPLASTVAAGS